MAGKHLKGNLYSLYPIYRHKEKDDKEALTNTLASMITRDARFLGCDHEHKQVWYFFKGVYHVLPQSVIL